MSVLFLQAQAQLPEKTAKAIDSLFEPWANNSGPGCAVAVVRHDSIIYAKAFGLANLEYQIPLQPSSPFIVASVSKQFTSFAIVLLSQQGRLALDDDIRKYLPWFPDLHEKITIRNLLIHTSGIRTADQLLGIAGTRLDDVMTQDDMIKVLSRQRGLNFQPGTQYSYSNSNYVLLAEIVRSVTGRTLRQYTDSVIFRPLGMAVSHFHDHFRELESGQAMSYYRTGKKGYANAFINEEYVGPCGLYSSATDLARWAMNFFKPKVGDAQTIQLMAETGQLNDGTSLNAALGIETDHYNGQLRYAHSGSQGGFHTFFSVFPEQQLGIIVLGNVEDFKPQRSSEQIAELFLPPPVIQPQPPVDFADTIKAILTDDHMQQYIGNYVSDDAVAIRIGIRAQKLVLYWATGNAVLLTPVARDTFSGFGRPDVRFIFSKDAKGQNIVDETWPGRTRHLVAYDLRAKAEAELRTYEGLYHSEELDCTYRILLKDHQLVLSGDKGSDIPLKLYGDDQLTNNTWFMPNIMITRNNRRRITGFEVDSDRVMHLWFKRL